MERWEICCSGNFSAQRLGSKIASTHFSFFLSFLLFSLALFLSLFIFLSFFLFASIAFTVLTLNK